MAETFEIPRLTSPHARILTACGDVLDEDKPLLKKLSGLRRKPMIALVQSKDSPYYLRLVGPTEKRKGHLHVDVASPAYFATPPVATTTAEEIVGVLADFIGRRYRAACFVRYVAPEIDVPAGSLIRRTAFDMKEENRSMHQVAGRFKFGGFPVDEFSWEIAGDEFRSEVTSLQTGPLSPTILRDAQVALDAFYSDMTSPRNIDEKREKTNAALEPKRKPR